jgi:hypothetical protein
MQEISESDDEIPETLKSIFERKAEGKKELNASIFSKNRGVDISSFNVEDEKMRKANAVFESMNIFSKIPMQANKIKPMFTEKLDKK